MADWLWERQSGIYGVLVFHSVVLVSLIIMKLDNKPFKEAPIVIDFTEPEMQKLEEKLAEEANNANIAGNDYNEDIRNMAKDANASEASKNTKNNKIFDIDKYIEEVQEQLDEKKPSDKNYDAEIAKWQNELKRVLQERVKDTTKTDYIIKDNTAVIYDIKGWKHRYLPIPVYKCEGSGKVVVKIQLSKDGYVVNCETQKNVSVDPCFDEMAIEAAKKSRFVPSENASGTTVGTITYYFISQ